MLGREVPLGARVPSGVRTLVKLHRCRVLGRHGRVGRERTDGDAGCARLRCENDRVVGRESDSKPMHYVQPFGSFGLSRATLLVQAEACAAGDEKSLIAKVADVDNWFGRLPNVLNGQFELNARVPRRSSGASSVVAHAVAPRRKLSRERRCGRNITLVEHVEQ